MTSPPHAHDPERSPPADVAGRPTIDRGNVAVAVVVIALVAAFWHETATFAKVSPLLAQNIPPEFFPRMVLATVAVLALLLPFEPLILARRAGGAAAAAPAPLPAMTWKTMALLVAIVVSIPWLGLVPAVALVSLSLPLLWGERRWKILLPFAVLFPATIHVVFTVLLQVRFEPGMLLRLVGVN